MLKDKDKYNPGKGVFIVCGVCVLRLSYIELWDFNFMNFNFLFDDVKT